MIVVQHCCGSEEEVLRVSVGSTEVVDDLVTYFSDCATGTKHELSDMCLLQGTHIWYKSSTISCGAAPVMAALAILTVAPGERGQVTLRCGRFLKQWRAVAGRRPC